MPEQVLVFVDGSFLGEGTIKNRKIAGFTGIFPSRDPMATTHLLDLLEVAIATDDRSSKFYLGHEITWHTR